MTDKKLSKKIISKKILQARHDHYLKVNDLSGLSGLTDVQISSLETGVNKNDCFVDDSHAIDCAKRVAISLGFTDNYFLTLGAETSENFDNSKNAVGLIKEFNDRRLLNLSTPIKNLDILSNFDFSLNNKEIQNLHNQESKFFLFFLSSSPSLMAPVLISLIAIACIVINFI